MSLNESSSLTKITDQIFVNMTKNYGQGQFGKIFKGFHSRKNKIIAIKFISAQIMKERQSLFYRQAQILQKLNNTYHPNILEFYGYQKNNNGLYIFCQFCTGGDLSKHIKTGLKQSKAIQIFDQILEGMTFLTQQNILHRDLKPTNIFLTEYNKVKIGDLGSAREFGKQLTAGGLRCTLLYAPPQFIFNHQKTNYDERCDVWSAGLIFFQMLTKKHLFYYMQNKNSYTFQFQDLKIAINKLKNENYKISMPQILRPQLSNLIRQMLTFDYEKRPTFSQIKQKIFNLHIEQKITKLKKNQFLQKSNSLLNMANPFESNKIGIENSILQASSYNYERQKQISYMLLNKVIKYIQFINQKNQIFIMIIHMFQKKYDFLLNVYKWLMMFLCTTIFILRNKKILDQIQQKQFNINGQIITKNNFVKDIQPIFQDLILYVKNNKQQILKNKKKIIIKILNKLLINYNERQKQRTIIWSKINLFNLLNKAKNNQYQNQQVYVQQYKQLVQKQVIINQQQYKQLNWQELKIYGIIILIYKIDIKFKFNQNNNQNYVQQELQRMINISQNQTIQFIKQLF